MGTIVANNDHLINKPLLQEQQTLKTRTWIETKKLWQIVGPSIFSRVATFSMNVITQAFAGHLGDLELASLSIANTVIVGFNFGLLLGMASALETLCGQAYGAKRYNMLGIYMQRSWIVLFLCCFLLLPIYVYATPLLKLLGQPDDVAEQSGLVAVWLIPLHFSFAFVFPLQRFLQSQLKAGVMAWVSLVVLVVHVFSTWVLVYMFEFGVVGIAVTLDVSWWLLFVGMFGYAWFGGCPETWGGFSVEAFSGLWEFVKLSTASGVMLCLENWYYRILILMTGNLQNATIAVDALSVWYPSNENHTNVGSGFLGNGKGLKKHWVLDMLNLHPLADVTFLLPCLNFLIHSFPENSEVRVANELGAGNGEGAKFATLVSVVQSTIIGFFFCFLIMVFHNKFALIFTSSSDVLTAVDNLSILLAVTILLNSVQPVLSGVAVGSGWQSKVAYVNLGSYYLIGVPLGVVMGWLFHLGVEGIWGGMIFGGTFVQTVILAVITMRCNWEKEAEKATLHVQKWSSSKPVDVVS